MADELEEKDTDILTFTAYSVQCPLCDKQIEDLPDSSGEIECCGTTFKYEGDE